MADFSWRLLDARWNNFKRWFEAMEKRDDKPVVLISDLREMIDFVDKMTDEADNLFTEMILKVSKEQQ